MTAPCGRVAGMVRGGVRGLERQPKKSSEVISQAGTQQENGVAHRMGGFGFLLAHRFGCVHPFPSAIRNTIQPAKP